MIPSLASLTTKAHHFHKHIQNEVSKEIFGLTFYTSDSSFIFTFIIFMAVGVDNIPKTNRMVIDYISIDIDDIDINRYRCSYIYVYI